MKIIKRYTRARTAAVVTRPLRPATTHPAGRCAFFTVYGVIVRSSADGRRDGRTRLGGGGVFVDPVESREFRRLCPAFGLNSIRRAEHETFTLHFLFALFESRSTFVNITRKKLLNVFGVRIGIIVYTKYNIRFVWTHVIAVNVHKCLLNNILTYTDFFRENIE